MANNNNNNENENNHNFNQGQMPFWEFIHSLDPNRAHEAGVGVDHTATGPSFGPGFPFDPESFQHWGGRRGSWGRHWGGPWGGPGPWGESPWGGRRGGFGRGRHGRRHHRDTPGSDREENPEEHDSEMENSPDTMRDDGPPGPPPPGEFPHPPPPPGPFHRGRGGRHHHHHHHHRGPGPFRRGGFCGGRGGFRGPHGPSGPPPPFNGPFDFRPLMHVLSGHPFAQGLRDYVDQTRGAPDAAGEGDDQSDTFVPPVDIFNTEKAYILHISLPGAVKEDVGVNWDADRSLLNVAGVIYRPGNEEFLQSLHSSERKIGMFERSIKLPPADVDENEEVDGVNIAAKMENGILIVTVPKVEKEWTEIHKIDVL